MGTYCDRCYTLCGNIGEFNSLEKYENWDVCRGCHKELTMVVRKDICRHRKYNTIGGLN